MTGFRWLIPALACALLAGTSGAAASGQDSSGTLATPGARITYSGIPAAYARAIVNVAAAARSVYADNLHCDMPAVVDVSATLRPGARVSLWTDGDSGMFLTVSSLDQLAPPRQSGVFNLYGICHEMGHMAMYRRCTLLGLPDGIGEGWAHYAGSVVTDEVYARLGSKAWPTPYDYRADGLARLRRQAASPTDATGKAAAAFLRAHDRCGAARVFAAMTKAGEGKPYGRDLMPRFVAALADATGDRTAPALFPAELLRPAVRWQTAHRAITDAAVEGLMVVRDAGGVTLKYDTDRSAGMASTAGSGHAVVFKRPAGDWAVDAVELFGSRYGQPTPPKVDFSIYLCDQDLNVIKEIRQPYSALAYGDKPVWNRLAFEPVRVPEGFYVCVYFDPTASRGFFVHYEKGHATKHSRSALPWSFVTDVDHDWMLRVHLRPAP